MSQNSLILSLPYIQQGQAQKHITHNEALRTLDVLVHLTVASRATAIPPTSPAAGDRYIIATGAIGDWAGQEGVVALYDQGTWLFHSPLPGWLAYVADEATVVAFNGVSWNQVGGRLQISDLQNLPAIGVGTTATAPNLLSVAADSTLLTHDGNDHRLFLNKASAPDTTSLVFQSNWNGHAEMGLTQTNDYTVKVSSDGAIWHEGMIIDRETGAVSFPNGGVRRQLIQATTWYIDPINGDDSFDGLTPTTAFATLNHAVWALTQIDGKGTIATLQLADGLHALTDTLRFITPLLGFLRIDIVGNIPNPDKVVLTTNEDILLQIKYDTIALKGIRLSCNGSGSCCYVHNNGILSFSDVEFEYGNRAHIECAGGEVVIEGDYKIIGEAQRHISCTLGGKLRGSNFTVTLATPLLFSQEFIFAKEASLISVWNVNVAGSATGRRYRAILGAIINTNGAGPNHWPGTIEGVIDTGGQYL